MPSNHDFLMTVLDEIEQREARLLTWGLVDSHLTLSELHAIIDQLLDDPVIGHGIIYLSANDVIAALVERALLFDIGEDSNQQYRSRMAEAVRLSFRLRQLFPKHAGPINWQAAPTLVADFRFLWRRRRYPERTTTIAQAIAAVNVATSDRATLQATAALLESYGEHFMLAEFQLKATARILGGFQGRSSATLVSAGTGSGKTLAFYLPALARVAGHIQADPAAARWVKVLALYPRNELLKDQFAEVYAQARRLDALLAGTGRRKILIGTFFGPTPSNAAYAHTARSGWRQTGAGLVCDFVRCPTPDCMGDMVWRDADRSAKRERLCCATCNTVIASDEIILTRERLASESPDILFTTTEMLNQRLGDSRYRHLFGIGDKAGRPVELMLLDEVHTYAGISGAQVAYLLRRWRWLLRRPVSFVGLSATLSDGARFFARLTGLSETACAEVSPSAGDMIAEGAEYLMALRGDPVSRTALLSTTIQTAMLMSRMLDAPDTRKSGGVLGERLFVFTDDVDVTNRMYFSMLDAEGRLRNGAPDMQRKASGGLAALRRPLTTQSRKLHGQDWEAVTHVGHSLQAQDRKAIGRVMAMDPGVGNNLDIIVATAALEVGFNDPRVGAVLQHKAPRDVAQFLQRKGRAGRSRRMRPWTVAILSDYGRDRIAYQAYDLLFDPELSPRSLPTSNRYIQRIQSVYATMDYLSDVGSSPRGSVWSDLSRPLDNARDRDRQMRLAGTLRQIVTVGNEQDRYADFLAKALRIAPEEIQYLLWDQPRPLLTEVLPTALRRLESNWCWQGRNAADYSVANSPLPEFVPANLFSNLNLPEVEIVLPQLGARTPEPVVMPIGQAMREFAPGRVSRRFGLSHERERHWVAPPLDTMREQAVPLDAFVAAPPLGEWPIHTSGGVARVPVFRPRRLSVGLPPVTVVDTSNARLRWCSQLVARLPGLSVAPPRGSSWADLVDEVRFFTHQGHCPIETRRLALGSNANLLFRDGSSAMKEYYYEAGGQRAALGFTLAVDAMCIRLAIPQDLWQNLGDEGAPLYRAMRTAYFLHQARNGPILGAIDNVFVREWLAQLILATLTNEAIAKSIDLASAARNLERGEADLDLDQTLNILFQSPIVDDANGQGNLQDRLRQDLAAHLADPHTISNLLSLARILFQPAAPDWEPWLRQRFSATIAAAALHATQSLCPEIDTDDLVVDIDPGPREPDDVFANTMLGELWISELSPGGNGHIEEVQRVYSEDPRRFFTLMTAALRDNDFALSDFQLQRFLSNVLGQPADAALPQTALRMRAAAGAEATHQAFTQLRHTLANQGYVTSHSFMVALANRVLRPGSSSESDRFLLNALLLWEAEEIRLGIELDARVLAYRLARTGDVDLALHAAGIDAPSVHPDQWRFSVIYGLLWPRGSHIRRAGLGLYSNYSELPVPEPLLVRPFLPEGAAQLNLADSEWRNACLGQLAAFGAATLICPAARSELLADALTFLATNPVQSNYLSVYARVQAIRRVGDCLEADVDIAEALQ